MNKPYSGNSKPFVLALFSEKDTEKVMPVLEALAREELAENGNWCSFQRDNAPELNL